MSTTSESKTHKWIKSTVKCVKLDGRCEENELLREDLFELIQRHLQNLKSADPNVILEYFAIGMVDHFTEEEFQRYLCETIASLSATHPDYGILAGRLFTVFQYHRVYRYNEIEKYSDLVKLLYNYTRPFTGEHAPLISKEIYEFFHHPDAGKERLIERRKIEEAIHEQETHFQQTAMYDYSAAQTIRNCCVHFVDESRARFVGETRATLFMRVALGIHSCRNLELILETFDLLCKGKLMHASPTLFNCGTARPQCSSCFLTEIPDDSIDGIYDSLKECAKISKGAGGLSISVTKIRASTSYIAGTNGESNGIAPMLKVYNDTARYVDQGGGKRKGAFAIYLEPWHADIFDFLALKRQGTNKDKSAPDLHYAIWMPDLFWKRLEEDGDWSLFCPKEAPGLNELWGEAFEKAYELYETPDYKNGKLVSRVRKTVKAEELYRAIIDCQVETGEPYMTEKDIANRCNNQQHCGMIHGSNLCTEIYQNTSQDESSVCNLISIPVNMYVNEKREFDFDEFGKTIRVAVRNLNKIIDLNHYPTHKTEKTNKKHRPIGMGIQGLQNLFWILGYPFDSKEAKKLNREIFEAYYYYALKSSIDEARVHGPYFSYDGSKLSNGVYHWKMYGLEEKGLSGRFDWKALDDERRKYGVRNSYFIAPMPTRSTSLSLNNVECFEAQMSNMIVRKTNTGEYAEINRYLVKELEALGKWNNRVRNLIIKNDGSVKGIDEIPEKLQNLYKTVWEIKQQDLIDLAAERQPFIDQGQSFSAFIADPSYEKLSQYHMACWKRGLKTGMYYLHMKPPSQGIKFTLEEDQEMIKETIKETIKDPLNPSNERKDIKKQFIEKNCDENCDMCGS